MYFISLNVEVLSKAETVVKASETTSVVTDLFSLYLQVVFTAVAHNKIDS